MKKISIMLLVLKFFLLVACQDEVAYQNSIFNEQYESMGSVAIECVSRYVFLELGSTFFFHDNIDIKPIEITVGYEIEWFIISDYESEYYGEEFIRLPLAINFFDLVHWRLSSWGDENSLIPANSLFFTSGPTIYRHDYPNGHQFGCIVNPVENLDSAWIGHGWDRTTLHTFIHFQYEGDGFYSIPFFGCEYIWYFRFQLQASQLVNSAAFPD